MEVLACAAPGASGGFSIRPAAWARYSESGNRFYGIARSTVEWPRKTGHAFTGRNRVTTYYPSNTVSSPPACSPCNTVAFGSGDADTYGVAATTGRMNSFQFKVGATPTTVAGTPGWNADGTLGSLAISDPFNSSNTQNCSYVYDDLARVQSVNCVNGSTTIWNQSFSLDAFGNISKSGSSSFAATYVLANGTTNNQEQLVGSCVPKYDANGNLTKDCSFTVPPTYAWDADGNPVGLHAVTLTFDALDREVEFNTGSSIRQILYSPIGKLGLANGQTAETTRIPLPGGSTAQMTGTGGTTYILHSDWLGSSKLTSNYSSRAITYDTAFAPYGEDYASSGNSPSNLDFTGQFEDTLAGLYDFLNREYDPVQGRWISPDPTGLEAVDPTNPQSWNRYAYALNNPLSNVDPLGLYCQWDDGSNDSTGDPDTGTQGQCEGQGGNWVPDNRRFTEYNPDPTSSSDGFTFYAQGTGKLDSGGDAATPSIMQCAAAFGQQYSLASGLQYLSGGYISQNNLVVSAFLGNDVSTLSNVLTGPNRLGNLASAGIANPTTANLTAQATKLVGNAPNPFSKSLGTATFDAAGNVAEFASPTIAKSLAETAFGSGAGRLLGVAFAEFTAAKFLYDATTYSIGAVACDLQQQ